MNALILLLATIGTGVWAAWAIRMDAADVRPCYCGGLYDCEDCGNDTCTCVCDKDGAPQTNHGVMA